MTELGDQVVEVDGGPVTRLRNLEVVVVLATNVIKKVTLQENVLMPVEVVVAAAEPASNVVRKVTCPGNVPMHHQEVEIESEDALIVVMKDTCRESVLNRRKNVVPGLVTSVVKKATCRVIVLSRMLPLLEEEVGELQTVLTMLVVVVEPLTGELLAHQQMPIPELQVVPSTGELGEEDLLMPQLVKRIKAVVLTAVKMDTCQKIAHNLENQEMQVEQLAEGVVKKVIWQKIALKKFLMRRESQNRSR